MRVLLLASVLMLGACTIGFDRRGYLNTLVGQSETELVRQLGVPTRTIESGGHRFLAYDEQYSSVVYPPSIYGGYWGRGYGWGANFPAEIVMRQCETTFEVVDNRVATWSLRGNACG